MLPMMSFAPTRVVHLGTGAEMSRESFFALLEARQGEADRVSKDEDAGTMDFAFGDDVYRVTVAELVRRAEAKRAQTES